MKNHHYQSKIVWTGNKGTGTDHYKNYERSHEIIIENKATILSSSDPAFRGDPIKHNPEDLFLSSIASCHMLWYLHLCANAGVIVFHYEDKAKGIMQEDTNGSGKFIEVTLNPIVIVKEESMILKAIELHEEANKYCFIANSLNFKVQHLPQVRI